MSDRSRKLILPFVILAAGIVIAVLVASARRTPERVERPALGPLVEVSQASLTDVPVVVTGHGEVVARLAVDVVPQVSGTVVEVHPSLVAGGFFRANQPLVVIDPRDWDLAVQRAEATVARARVTLEREQAEAAVAREEWNALNPDEAPPSGLVVREPQVRQAQAELEAALADLETARLNLERTRVSVPFDGVVVSKSVDLGQFVTAGARIASVYGTDVVEVRVPLESRELAWFDTAAARGAEPARAEVGTAFAGNRHTWEGTVVRMEAEVDQSSRMVHVVVEIRRPYDTSSGRPPLLPGTFVDVEIQGRTLEQVVSLPRHAIHDGNTVWVFEDGALRIREVDVVRSDRRQALVASGLSDGELVIVSALDAVTDGMIVRMAEADRPAARAGGIS